MKNLSRFLAIALLIAAPAAFAQTGVTIPEASVLPVDEPLDVGGTILQPGQYLIRVLPNIANRNQVQITSMDRQTVYATVLTVPHQLEPTEEMPTTMYVYYPAGEGQPKALRTWYAPDPVSKGGHDIVYEESRAKQLARLANTDVVSYTGQVVDAGTTELHRVTPQATVEEYTVPAPRIAESTTTTTTEVDERPTQIAEARTEELPQTAGNVPTMLLLGLLSVAAAVVFRVLR